MNYSNHKTNVRDKKMDITSAFFGVSTMLIPS